MVLYSIMIAVGGPKLYEVWHEANDQFRHCGYFDTREEAEAAIKAMLP